MGDVKRNSESPRPGSTSALGRLNRQRVIQALQGSGGLTQAEISRSADLAPATVSKIVRELTQQGIVTVHSPDESRTRHYVTLARTAGIVAGADLGHRYLTVALADLNHTILGRFSERFEHELDAKPALERTRAAIDKLCAEAAESRTHLRHVGLGLPSPIDILTGQVGAMSILPGWVGINAAELASEVLGVPVSVDNDANLGALAESRHGAGQGTASFAYLKLGDGVGAGIVLEGKLFRGPRGTAGEIGHTTVDEYGKVCRCGNRGCLETLVNARAIVRALEDRFEVEPSIADVIRMARGGDPGCRRVLEDTGRLLGLATANLCNVINPDKIVIGGQLAQAEELITAPLREAIQRFGIPSAVRSVDVSVSALGPDLHVRGAIDLALDHVLDENGLRDLATASGT